MGWTFWTHATGAQELVAAPEVRAAAAPAYVDVAEIRTIIGDTKAEVEDEVAHIGFLEGWQPVGEVQRSTDADGEVVYSQTVVR